MALNPPSTLSGGKLPETPMSAQKLGAADDHLPTIDLLTRLKLVKDRIEQFGADAPRRPEALRFAIK